MINDPSFRVFDQWQVQVQAMILLKADCYLYSMLDGEVVKKALLKPIDNVDTALQQLLGKYGPQAAVAVLPLGPLTIPYIKKP